MRRWEIQYRELVIRSITGKRLRNVVKERYKTWDESPNFQSNFTSCLEYLKANMLENHTSFTMHIHLLRDGNPTAERVRVAQIKWGFDDKPFVRLDYRVLAKLREGELVNA